MKHPAILPVVLVWLVATGCISRSRFDETVAGLQDDIAATREQLRAAHEQNAVLARRLAELAELEPRVESRAAEARELRTRLDDVERLRLEQLRTDLETQQRSLADLTADLDQLRASPPMTLLAELEKRLSDVIGQVELNRRQAASNSQTLDRVSRALDEHETEFNRQMKLLSQYVREQLVPLAEGLVSHLYDESRRLSASAEQLEELARRVDPYKFRHLVPGYVEERPPAAVPEKAPAEEPPSEPASGGDG